ncbi:MAG: hypothetical protein AAB553_00500 [Patescibacteria group bacterium]
MKDFGHLFKKYRLQAEFYSLSKLSLALADRGYLCDVSLLSLWQRGKRIPTHRAIIIKLVALFIERRAITSLDQANDFMESAGHGYLTKSEQMKLLDPTVNKSIVLVQNFTI